MEVCRTTLKELKKLIEALGPDFKGRFLGPKARG